MKELIDDGDGPYWCKLKSPVIQQTRFKAVTALSEERNLMAKHYEAAETLVKSALVSIKAKSAAVHYEEQVAFAFSLGAFTQVSARSCEMFTCGNR